MLIQVVPTMDTSVGSATASAAARRMRGNEECPGTQLGVFVLTKEGVKGFFCLAVHLGPGEQMQQVVQSSAKQLLTRKSAPAGSSGAYADPGGVSACRCTAAASQAQSVENWWTMMWLYTSPGRKMADGNAGFSSLLMASGKFCVSKQRPAYLSYVALPLPLRGGSIQLAV